MINYVGDIPSLLVDFFTALSGDQGGRLRKAEPFHSVWV